MDDATRLSRCSRCGAELPADAAEGLCPACLMAAAISNSATALTGDEATVLSASVPGVHDADSRLTANQAFGPYRIGRLLGRGGMGEVYEAEQLEHGRRVALKVLNQRLAGPEDRARFLREGQLAASVSHPNTVYIFGSEEISGTPVISMELVAGGTLKDRVERDGPMKPAEAVDAILDVIAGLDAAQAGGILHRDIKPSNCFIDPDGRVKVGDFGLSISTLARDVSQRGEIGGFQGTPQYAAPEQLRGQPLDLRADIYAVGATLYYLLTGHPPFDDRDLASLVQRVTNEAPASPRIGRRRLPRGLADVVLRCLAKDRAARPASYAELEDALRLFSSTAPTPATLGLRFVAGVIDKLVLALITSPITLAPQLEFAQPASVNFGVHYVEPGAKGSPLFGTVAFCAITLLYYVLLEGLGDASLGKRFCGLRVSRAGRRPGVWWALVRTTVFLLPLWWTILSLDVAPEPGGAGLTAGFFALVGVSVLASIVITWIMFTSMRRRNGFAAWHDLASGTRVMVRRRVGRVALEPKSEIAVPSARRAPRLGPFEVTGTLGMTTRGELLSGFDPVLRRQVWLHVLPPGSAPLPPALRDLARPGRLRWLSGHRSEQEAWDVYEAPGGIPLTTIIRRRQPWRVVRHWIADLARELNAAGRDGAMPVLALDRVWITRGSRAMFVDVAGATGSSGSSPSSESAQRFLAEVAAAALDEHPIPLAARNTLKALGDDAVPAGDLVKLTAGAAVGADRVTPWRRAVAIALANVPAIFVAIAMIALLPLVSRVARQDFLLPFNCLIEINKLDSKTDPESLQLRRALETYCAAKYGRTYADDRYWRDWRARQITTPLQSIGARLAAAYPLVSPVDAAAAEVKTRTTLNESEPSEGSKTAIGIMLALPTTVLFLVFVMSLLSTLLVRGGLLMRLLGVAVVDRRGLLASRSRSLWRVVVAWSPLIPLWIYAGTALLLGTAIERTFFSVWLVGLPLAVILAGVTWTIAHPQRGWHDRVAGTSVVPR